MGPKIGNQEDQKGGIVIMKNIDSTGENMDRKDKRIIGIITDKVEDIGDTVLIGRGDMNRGMVAMEDQYRRIEDIQGKKETVQGIIMSIVLIGIVMKDLEGMKGMDIGEDKRMEREDKGEV